MDEFVERLKEAVHALDGMGAPLAGGEARSALELVASAQDEMHRLNAAPWWRRIRARRRLGRVLEALEEEIRDLANAAHVLPSTPGPEFA